MKIELYEEFLNDMAKCFDRGNQKEGRKPYDWKKQNKQEAILRHEQKIRRHLTKLIYPLTDDDLETAKQHAAAIACNAMILWYFS